MRRLFLSLVSITIVSLSLSAKTIPDFTIEVAKAHDYYFKLKFKKISATEVSLIGIEQWELWIDDYELTIEEKYKDPDYGDEYTVTMVGDMGNNRNDYTAEKADSYDYPGFSIYEVAYDTQNRQLTKLVLPSTVSIIFHNAFSGMKSLQKIDLGDNVAHIGQRVFSECKALKSIIFPDKVTKLFDFVCEGCTALESITIGSGMQKIISLSFTDCVNLKTITALPTTPPSINLDSHYVFPKDISAKVIVPIESKSAYEKDWGTIYPKMTFEGQTTSSVKNINDDVSSNIKVLGRTLNIYGSNIAIYNSQAQLVAKACGVYTSTLPAGVYIVVIDGKTQKIIIR